MVATSSVSREAVTKLKLLLDTIAIHKIISQYVMLHTYSYNILQLNQVLFVPYYMYLCMYKIARDLNNT